jgi:hypothetical protein
MFLWISTKYNLYSLEIYSTFMLSDFNTASNRQSLKLVVLTFNSISGVSTYETNAR